MRIIAGSHKGRRLFAPTGQYVRPTTDRVKQYIFDVLGPEILDANVLDLFSGSGSLGFEALSRGARHVTFVELNKSTIKIIQRNAKLLQLSDRMTIKPSDAAVFLLKAAKNGVTYDLIFADPPYEYDGYDEIVNTILSNRILNRNGSFVLEHNVRRQFELRPDYNVKIRFRKLGTTGVTIFQYE